MNYEEISKPMYRINGVEVTKRRKERGYTQEQLSEEAGLSSETIRSIERNRVVSGSVNALSSIARALTCDVKDLIIGEK